MYWDSTTPRAEIIIPMNCLALRLSCPSSQATIAATTGIRAEKILDLATPRLLIVLTHNEKARLEHRTDRQIMGYHTSEERYLGEKSSIPLKMNRGSRYTEPIRNWYMTITWLE